MPNYRVSYPDSIPTNGLYSSFRQPDQMTMTQSTNVCANYPGRLVQYLCERLDARPKPMRDGKRVANARSMSRGIPRVPAALYQVEQFQRVVITMD